MVDFLLLGPLEARHEGRSLDLGRRRAERCLLGILLLEAGSVVPADRLVDLIWDAEPPATGRSILQIYMSRLRSALDPDRDGRFGVQLLARGDGYQAQVRPEAVDAHIFRARTEQALADPDPADRAATLREALAWWRGPLLAGDISDRLRDRLGAGLAELRLQAWEACLEADLSLGRHRRAVGELAELAQAHPLRERLIALHMLALYRNAQPAEALATFRRTRELLVAELGVEPGRDLHELHLRILNDDPGLELPAPAAVAVSGPPAPRTLPRRIPDFVGRAAELARLTDGVEAGRDGRQTVVISGIAGIGGVGKTALALHWAHQHAARFPDGQLFVNLRGFDTAAPLRAADALAVLLGALGVAPDRIPLDVESAAGLYRSLLAGKRMLIVLDNAHNAAQVRPLLPGDDTTTVIVTSRDALAGLVAQEGAALLHLDVLSAAESVRLLAEIIGPDRVGTDAAGLDALARLCGYLPLALRIAAARLTADPRADVAGLVAELSDSDRLGGLAIHDDPQTAVRMVFEHSYRALSPADQELFRRLGLVPGLDFPSAAAAALAGVDAEQAERGLRHLADAHLVTETVPGRFTMHDLLREYAESLCEQVDGETATLGAFTRLTDWYLEQADAAARVLDPNMARMREAPPVTVVYASRPEAAAWLDTERAALVSLIVRAAVLRLPQASVLADALRPYLAYRAPIDLVQAGSAALEAAEHTGDLRAQVAMHLGQTNAMYMMDRHAEAIAAGERARAIVEKLDWPLGRLTTASLLGTAHLTAGNLGQSAQYSREALEIAQTLGAEHSVAVASGRLSLLALLRGHLPEAAQRFEDANKQLGPGVELAVGLFNLAEVCLLLGDTPRAADLVAQAMAQIADADNPVVEASARITRAAVGLAQGQLDAALADAERAERALVEATHPQVKAHGEYMLARVLLEQQRLDRAEAMIEAALRTNAQIGMRHSEVETQTLYADLLRRQGRLDEAAATARQALDTALACEYELLAGQARTVLAEILLAAGDRAAAAQQARRALAEQDALEHTPGAERAARVLAAAS
ncbi:AfsR/SARP family transcriptional regulator [Catellatospora tritici]|uniref:AfsR/SARP family transcriptional regulator n=1 Tax=Catellatospora tritici TaxID=2851566 RepID=UPI001C2D0EAA|nr:BTAD domain-containing putative transcriptional regulator [Catellatospora tritici]MBV1850740.1 winged helix-turn-helix domain-containing protein [Catellatospora tritici]MBV1850993.1 winged helix-turn-helix domain-containing protein [Catellatospora tritici]